MSVVDVNTEGLGDLSRALTKKRLDCMKLLEALNAPPRGLSDLMAQTRAFTDKLSALLEDGSELSDSIKNELVDDNGFPGHVRRLPLEDIYNDIARVKEELRISDGYQPYLVAPEAGLRAIFEKSIGSLSNPVRDLVDSVHGIVTMAADRAIKESCQVPALERGPPVVRFPHYIEQILPVANIGLEELKEEAMKMAVRMVEMEQCFVSCSFFRYLTFRRIQDQQEALKRRDATNRQSRKTGEEDEEEEEDDARSVAETEVSLPPVLPGDAIPNVYSSPDAVFGVSGYLEKSSTRSRNKLTQFESSLWQRRFFGVRDNAKTLEYYHSEEAFLKGTMPSVAIQLADCVVSDTDGQGVLPQSTISKSTDHLDAETQISLLIFLRNKDPEKAIYKKSKDLILRAEDAADKYRWLNYLRNTISDSRAGARVAAWSTRALPQSPKSTDTSVPAVQEKTERGHGRADGDVGLRLGQGHGLGSAVFWDPICRDADNSLLPSPGILLEDDAELSMENALVQHATDMKDYTRLACDTLVMTVPKVIVHLLVDKSTESLGPKIEEYILRLPDEDKDMLLEEDAGIAGHRRQVQDTVSDIGKAQQRLKEAERSMGQSPTAKIDVSIIERAGLTARLKKNEEGVYVFINKPKPPTGKRNVTPERRREAPPQGPARSQPPAAAGGTAQPGVTSRGSLQRTAQNGTNPPAVAPKRPPPPSIASTAASRSQAAPQSGAPNGGSAALHAQQSSNKTQQPKPPQSTGWYGFKPFGRS